MKSVSLNKGYVLAVTVCTLLLSGLAVTNVYPLTYPSLAVSMAILFIPIAEYIMANGLKIKVTTLLLVLMFLPPFFRDVYNYKYGISVIAFIVTALMVTKVVPFERFAYLYTHVIFAIAIISLIGYWVVNFTSIQLPFITMDSAMEGVSYKIGFVYNYLPYQKDRNCGVFWEPGLFSTHLVIAYLLTMKNKPNGALLYKVIFILTVLTTKSSAGYCLILLCLILEMTIHFCSGISKKQTIFSFCIVFVLLLAAIFVSTNEEMMSSILLGSGSGGGITKILGKLQIGKVFSSQRGSAISFWLTQFIENPVLGRGFVRINEEYIWDTCTNFMFLGGCGILGFTYTYCWIKAITRIKSANASSKLLIIGIVFIILNKEPHAKILLTWMILFYLMSDSESLNLKKCQVLSRV